MNDLAETRLTALGKYWGEFDRLHASHISGSESLWGILDDGVGSLRTYEMNGYRHKSYQWLMSDSVNELVNATWSRTALQKWPDVAVSQAWPHALVAETFGPALDFWQGIALTAWYIVNGPYSRTDARGAKNYFADQLASMSKLGTPVPEKFFKDLIAAEGQAERMERRVRSTKVIGKFDGMELVSEETEPNPAAYETLGGVVDEHRHRWAAAHLEEYLAARLNQDVDRMANDPNAKEDTHPKATGPLAPVVIARRWTGGDVAGALSLGQHSASIASATADRRLPRAIAAFEKAVFERISGPGDVPPCLTSPELRSERSKEDNSRIWWVAGLAEKATQYKQYEEAIGAQPAAKHFGGPAKFRSNWGEAMYGSPQDAWGAFAAAVEDAATEVGVD